MASKVIGLLSFILIFITLSTINEVRAQDGNSTAVALTYGVAVSSEIEPQSYTYFSVVVETDQEDTTTDYLLYVNVIVETTLPLAAGGTIEVIASQQANPTWDNATVKTTQKDPFKSGSETYAQILLTAANPAQGAWYIGVYNSDSMTTVPFSVTAFLPEARTLEINKQERHSLAPGRIAVYIVDAHGAAKNGFLYLSVNDISNADDEFHAYVREDLYATRHVHDYSSGSSAGDIQVLDPKFAAGDGAFITIIHDGEVNSQYTIKIEQLVPGAGSSSDDDDDDDDSSAPRVAGIILGISVGVIGLIILTILVAAMFNVARNKANLQVIGSSRGLNEQLLNDDIGDRAPL